MAERAHVTKGAEGRTVKPQERPQLWLYNTLGHEKMLFEPLKEGEVSIYVCGPTVYDHVHIGNARPLLVFDVLRRLLIHDGYRVRFAMNYTDIDDKLIRKANEEGVSVQDVATRCIEWFEKERDALAVLKPDETPRATQTIDEIVSMIQQLIELNVAYVSTEGVYFDVSADPDYGKLTKLDHSEMISGSRTLSYEVDDKRSRADFALWKFARPGEPSYPAPFGAGRPGWHIECSAMIRKIFGGTIDIHGGGQDLIFPHHENEIAQSECCFHEPLSRYWLHNAYITMDQEKMSKSLGNIRSVKAIGEEYGYDTLRYYILSAQYRTTMNFTSKSLPEAKTSLLKIRESLERMTFMQNKLPQGALTESIEEKCKAHHQAFFDLLRDDLNTPGALGELFKFLHTYHLCDAGDELKTKENVSCFYEHIKECLDVLGLYFDEEDEIPKQIKEWVQARQEARTQKDFQAADHYRDLIQEAGYGIKDTPQGPQIIKVG